MFSRSLRLARIGGVDVRIDPGSLFLALLLVWVFRGHFGVPGRHGGVALVMAATGTGLFFVSLLAHELAHALEGTHRGVDVHGITLMVFGGVTEMGHAPSSPRDEFAISAVGPYVSLVAGAAFGIAATLTTALEGPAAVAEVAGTLGWLNVLLAVFNLIPGAPLDGGRVLRAAVWSLTRDRHRAVRWASWAGQGVAVLLFLWALRLFQARPDEFLGALWTAVIGWFIWEAARAERRQTEVEELLDGRTIAALTVVEPPQLPADRTLDTVVDVMAGASGMEVFPVVDGGRLVGVLQLSDVMEVGPEDRPFRTVAELLHPLAELRTVGEDEDLLQVAEAVSDGSPVVVVDAAGQVRGVVTPGQMEAALDRWHALARRREYRVPAPRQRDRDP